MGFPRQEYWSGLPFPSPGDLPNPGIELGSPALQADSLLTELPRDCRINPGAVVLEPAVKGQMSWHRGSWWTEGTNIPTLLPVLHLHLLPPIG